MGPHSDQDLSAPTASMSGTGIRGGPDPDLINTELYPLKIEN
jgi:hypothetical protein